MELKDTVKMMLSNDYKERLKAEYLQTKIRRDKLYAAYQTRLQEFGNSDERARMFALQADAMLKYMDIMAERMRLEGIDPHALC